MKNLYEATARPVVETSRLAGVVSADVAIIGGGYTGLSAALRLAEGGANVVLLEAADIGHGCSGRNGGQVNPGLKELPDDVEKHWGSSLGARMNRMASDAAGEVFDLIGTLGIDCEPRRTGSIRAAVDAAGLRQVNAHVHQNSAAGHPVRYLDAQEIARLTGTNVYLGGAMDGRGGHINPLAYARGLALAAQGKGAALFTQSRVESISRQNGGFRLKTQIGQAQATQLIVCTNGYADGVWPGLQKAMVPVYTYLTATEPLPQAMRDAIMPCGSALFETAWDVVYYRLDDAGRLIIGGRGPQRDARGNGDYQHLRKYALKLWPFLQGIKFPWGWYGQVSVTPDHYPHLVEPEPGVRLMYGYNGRGIAVATAAGKMLADRVLSGGQTEIALPVRTALHPVPFHRFWRAGAHATIVWNLLKDTFAGR